MEQFAVMNIEKGEEIVAALASGSIEASGRYKFLAKKKRMERSGGRILWKGIMAQKKKFTRMK